MALFLSYMYYQGLVISRRQSCKHISMAATTPEKLYSTILNPTKKMLCINDVKLSDDLYTKFREMMASAFETLLPSKSRFEI